VFALLFRRAKRSDPTQRDHALDRFNKLEKEVRKSQCAVYVVDDDISVRNSLSNLFRSIDLPVETFESPGHFLQSARPEIASCIVLDIRMPGSSGLDFQREIAKAGINIPVIFLTAHGDIQMSVQAMKAGAVDFLTKPYREQDMLDAVHAAIECDRRRRQEEVAASDLRMRFESLSRREQEIMILVTRGLMNKQVAAEARISETTVKIHRGNVMQKMRAASFAELVRMADSLNLRRTKSS
jgi:FixJ family two-component response regulator